MRPVTRRDALRLTGSGVAASVAGCLADRNAGESPGSGDGDGGDGTGGDGNEDGNGDGDASGEGDGDGNDGGETALRDVETIQFAATHGEPGWYDPNEESVGDVIVIDSRERTSPIWPHDDVPRERREDVADFLEGGSFADSVLLYVESVGPNACHDALEVENVALEDGTLTADAAVVDASDERTDCASAVTFPSALVRATFAGEPATEAELSIVDGWGTEATVSAAADDPIAPAVEDLEGYVRPDGDPPAVPDALECKDEGVERLENPVAEDALEMGAATGDDGEPTLALRADRLAVALGERVTITMTNVTDGERYTGNRNKHSLEIYTAEGWRDVRVGPETEPVGHSDEAIVHAPGAGFEWTIELTEDGVLDEHDEALEVCPALRPGRYRFVFWEPAVAVAFDVTAE